MQDSSNHSNSKKIPKDDTTLLDEHRDALKAFFPIDSIYLTTHTPQKSVKPRKSSKVKLASKGAGFLSIVIAITFWLDPAYHTEYYSTPVGGRNSVALIDQSIIHLNTQAQLAVHTHLRYRRVTLVHGQAMFDVKHHAYKPFYVDAGQTQVKVVGTKFEVFKQQEHVTVTVLEGKVRVIGNTHANQPQQSYLTPNQQTVLNSGESAPVRNINALQETAWVDGKLIFEHTPLHLAMAQVQRYYPASIALDAKAANLKITGVFNTNQTQQMLRLLPNILPVNVKKSPTGEITITKK